MKQELLHTLNHGDMLKYTHKCICATSVLNNLYLHNLAILQVFQDSTSKFIPSIA